MAQFDDHPSKRPRTDNDTWASNSPLKVELMQNLTKIRTTNYALLFCSLLIQAQKKHEKCVREENCGDCLEHDNEISSDIKNILINEPVDALVKVIFKALRAPDENSYEKEQQILNLLLESECEERPTEYLNKLIENVQSLVSLFFSTELYYDSFNLKVKDYEKNLVALKGFMLFYGKSKARDLFFCMFKIGVNKHDFSLGEKKAVEGLMFEAMPYIETFIRDSSSDSKFGLGIVRLQKRSALQFIRDLLADYSAEYGTLRELIGTLDAAMEALDDIATELDIPRSYDFCTEIPDDECFYYGSYFGTLELFNLCGGSNVPKEHTWWQVYKTAHL